MNSKINFVVYRYRRNRCGGVTGASGTVREFIWLPETEIAPTMDSRAQVDRPLATVEAVNTIAPVTNWVSVDHLNRPE